ncbi:MULTISPECIES: hypothetical protein [unclassified Streptomyces]|uniref:hypothetical protein n=1 Tax=Streptomyces sp. NPDC005955 TaxID=3364738 RepID=UPI003675BDE6
MTHAAPAPGTPAAPGGTPTTGRTAGRHRAPRTRTGVDPRATGTWLPVLAGIVYGFWVAGISRDASGYQVTGWNILLGFVSGILFAGIAFGLHRVGPALPKEARALAWAVFAGLAVGFCYSQTGHSVLLATGIALGAAFGTGVATFYHYYVTED